jgi:hypothetical protein
MQPYNIKPVPVDIDGEGMRSDALRTVLTEWDEAARGMPRYKWSIVPRTLVDHTIDPVLSMRSRSVRTQQEPWVCFPHSCMGSNGSEDN